MIEFSDAQHYLILEATDRWMDACMERIDGMAYIMSLLPFTQLSME